MPNRWSQGPPFLLQDSDEWPVKPNIEPDDDASELRKSTFFGITSTTSSTQCAEVKKYDTWKELLEATVQELQGAADQRGSCTAEDYRNAEVLKRAQRGSFPDELWLLKVSKPISSSSRLLTLSPEIDAAEGLIHVRGRLRRAKALDQATVHPIVLDPGHPSTRLLIQDFNSRLHHPGPERVFAEIRRSFWILQGREAIRRYQHTCSECQRWKAKPSIPKMADLPPACLRLFKPGFFSTGMDCFGPFQVKVGRPLR